MQNDRVYYVLGCRRNDNFNVYRKYTAQRMYNTPAHYMRLQYVLSLILKNI